MRAVIIAFLVAIIVAVGSSPAAAKLVGGSVIISGPGGMFPDVAYDRVDGKYLVVWPDYGAAFGSVVIAGRFVTSDGAPSGGIFAVSDLGYGALYPAIAYNSINNEFLVTWDQWDRPGVIWGQRIDAASGARVGPNFGIGTVPGGARSGVAWSSGSNCYLVIYGNWSEVYGQRVNHDGTLLGVNFNISHDADFSGYPAVCYGSSGDRFLVTWDHSGLTSPIHGQLVDASTGNLFGNLIEVTSLGEEDRSTIAYDDVNSRFFVQYNEKFNPGYGYDQFGQFVNADGTLYFSPIPIAHTAAFEGETLLGCDVACCPAAGRFQSVFQYYPDGPISGVGSQETDTSGNVVNSLVMLGVGENCGPQANAADTTRNRFLTVWGDGGADGGVWNIRGQLWEVDKIPPALVSGLTATPGDGQVTLSWTNPSDSDFAGWMIRSAIGAYPSSPTDGQLVACVNALPGSPEVYTQTGLNGGITYYYSLFTYDGEPNYSGPASISCVPTGGQAFSTSSFTSGADGWTSAVWKSGALDPGTMAWNGTAGNSGGGMRCTGAGTTDSADRCTREGGEISKVISTVHFDGIKVLYDLRVNALGGNYTGAGTGTCAVDHNLIDEQLTVYYSTDAGSTWTEAEYITRATLLGYQSYGTRQIDLSAVPGVANTTSFALKFRWQLNRDTDTADIDNIVVRGNRMETIQPTISVTSPSGAASCPANVTPFAVGGKATDNVGVTGVTWSSNKGGSGSCSVSAPGDRNVDWNANVTLVSGQNMLTFRASDLAGNIRTTTQMIVYCPDAPLVIGDAKKLADNALAYLASKTVTAVYGSYFYVQEPGRSGGIRIKPYSALAEVVIGKRVDVGGNLKTETNGERYINGSAVVTGEADVLSPVGMMSRSLGGSSWFYSSGASAGQCGIEGGLGLSNLGLLVTVWGKVTQRDTTGLQYFYIDDGFGAVDGTQTAGVNNVGVRVSGNPTSYPTGTWVGVTGISTCFKDAGGHLRWQVTPRTDDIRLFAP